MRVEVCGFDGKPMSGRTLADATPVVGDQFRTKLAWGEKSDIGVSGNEPVILHFVMDHAKIYSLDFE